MLLERRDSINNFQGNKKTASACTTVYKKMNNVETLFDFSFSQSFLLLNNPTEETEIIHISLFMFCCVCLVFGFT